MLQVLAAPFGLFNVRKNKVFCQVMQTRWDHAEKLKEKMMNACGF